MELKFQVQTKIKKPISEVFESVVNPQQLCGYFTKTASAPLTEGKKILWTWAEFPQGNEVEVKKIEKDKLISLEWDSHSNKTTTRIEMKFETLDKTTTMIKISEMGWKTDQQGLNDSYDNCQGWQHMTCCMKAYLEHKIDLRGGNSCT